ncbi:MAG: tetratricopeptide repeat protein, partial [Rubrivivax sp.]|nr:tetratricopeptide repeat protein [Rubrivivax sp.]
MVIGDKDLLSTNRRRDQPTTPRRPGWCKENRQCADLAEAVPAGYIHAMAVAFDGCDRSPMTPWKHLALAAALAAAGHVAAAPLNASGQDFGTPAAAADSPQAREHRAGIQAQLAGDLAAARRHFTAALKADARYVPAIIGLAAVAQAEGRREEVERLLQEAERVDPKSPAVHLAWGRLLAAGGQFVRAEQSLIKARDLAPKALPPLLELGDLYLRSPAKQADALRTFGAAVKLAPGNARAHYGLGVASAAAGRRDEALAALARAAE